MSQIGILAALAERPKTVRELEAELGIRYTTVLLSIQALWDDGVIHVGKMRRDSHKGPKSRVWALGPGRNAPNRKKRVDTTLPVWRSR